MTMGTSIICGSLFFTFTCHTPPRRNYQLAWRGSKGPRRHWVLRGLMVQKFEGLFAADSVPDSIEAPILCQSSTDRFGSLFGLLCQRIEFMIQLVFADVDALQLRDAFQ